MIGLVGAAANGFLAGVLALAAYGKVGVVRVPKAGVGLFALGWTNRRARTGTLLICLCEILLVAALVASPSLTVSLMLETFWGLAAAFVVYLHRVAPEAGCGCFGTAAKRERLLPKLIQLTALMALTLLAGLAAENSLATVAVLVSVLAVGLARGRWAKGGWPVECEVDSVADILPLRRLRLSPTFRRRSRQLRDYAMTDDWREGCWWYFQFEGPPSRELLIFAVSLRERFEVRVGTVEPEPIAA